MRDSDAVENPELVREARGGFFEQVVFELKSGSVDSVSKSLESFPSSGKHVCKTPMV